MTTAGQLIGELELAGMVKESGELDGAVLPPPPGTAPCVPPYIELEGDRLYYIWAPFALGFWGQDRPLVEQKGMLDAFLRIQDGQGVLRFARRYGPLRICEHGLPAAHRRHAPVAYEPPVIAFDVRKVWGWAETTRGRDWTPIAKCHPLKDKESGLHWDPIGRWLDYAEQARALVGIAAKLHQGKLAGRGDWTALEEVFPLDPHGIDQMLEDADVLNDPTKARRYLALAVDDWLDLGGVRPRLAWHQDGPRIILEPDFFGGWTFGMLAVLLMGVITLGTVTLCSGCGRTYLREGRVPQAGRRNFCLECGSKVAARLRKRAQRQRRGSGNDTPKG